MPVGGKRVGAGRKPGSKNAKTVAIATTAMKLGISPLEVILQAMREAYEAQNIKEAAVFAEKAAPYCHPRLSSVDMNATIKRDIADFADAELAAIAGGAGSEDRVGTAQERSDRLN